MEPETITTKNTSTQQQAINIAVGIVKNQHAEVVIHGRNGKIRDKDSYGNDPKTIKTLKIDADNKKPNQNSGADDWAKGKIKFGRLWAEAYLLRKVPLFRCKVKLFIETANCQCNCLDQHLSGWPERSWSIS